MGHINDDDKTLAYLAEYFEDEPSLERSLRQAQSLIAFASSRENALLMSPRQVRALHFYMLAMKVKGTVQ